MVNRQTVLMIADSLLATFVFFPVVCCYWRGSWDLIGYYTLPGHIPDNFWVIAGIGTFSYFNQLLLPLLDKYLDRSRKITFFLATRLFMNYHAALYMFFWRGYWELANYYGGTEWQESLITLSIILVMLGSIGCLRSSMWPPFLLFLDTRDDLLKVCLRLNFKPAFKVCSCTNCKVCLIVKFLSKN